MLVYGESLTDKYSGLTQSNLHVLGKVFSYSPNPVH